MEAVTIREYRPEDLPKLLAMYGTFEPRGAARGLPPVREEKTQRWLRHLGARASSLIAVELDGEGRERVAGHVILAEGDDNDAELALFVHQDYRRRGLGTDLTRAAIEHARRQGRARLWLTVAPENAAAIQVYRKAGFHMQPGKWFPDHEMELWLSSGPSSVIAAR
jgi:ribosomal protein S18 acetylase RimI-like enzyme